MSKLGLFELKKVQKYVVKSDIDKIDQKIDQILNVFD